MRHKTGRIPQNLDCATGFPDIKLSGALFFGDLAEFIIVEQDQLDGHVVLHGSRYFGHILPKSAIPRHGNDGALVSYRCPGTHSCWKGKADGTQIAGHQEVVVGLAFVIAPKRIGIVTHIYAHNGIGRCQAVERIKYGNAADPFTMILF
jgi:hypothetical protein